jgi:hypothetical protein
MNKRTNCRHASLRRLTTLCVGLVLASLLGVAAHARSANYQALTANLGGVRIHYLKAGAVGHTRYERPAATYASAKTKL